jgi:hypothetical protein
MTETRQDLIMAIIEENGPQGVNALSKALDIPLSTMQKYLHNQKYFKLNDQRKWDLPQNVQTEVKADTLALQVNVLETSILLIKSQLAEITHSVETSLEPMNALKRNISNYRPSVANTSQSELPPRVKKLLEILDTLPKLIKSNKSNLSDETYQLLIKTRWVDLIIDNGSRYLNSVIEPALHDVLLGEKDELSEDALITIKEYQ